MFKDLLPPDSILTSPEDLAAYGKDWTKGYQSHASAVLLPRTVDEVRAIARHAFENRIPLVPSSGRTGLSAGAVAASGEVVLSLERMTKILDLNITDRTLTCEAGAITENVQREAEQAGLFYPIDLASRGSCRIGGNISTNAGGLHVIRYGHTRDQVLGLKVVTGTGELLSFHPLVKNQPGYDLRSLFIGSEGTLGIVVEATLKLQSPPRDSVRLIFGVSSREKVLELLRLARESVFPLSLYEYFPRRGLEAVLKHHPLRDPLSEPYPHYVLCQFDEVDGLRRELFEEEVAGAIDRGLAGDVVMSTSARQFQDFMAYRELIGETLSCHYHPHKSDLAVPVHALPEFMDALDALLAARSPKCDAVLFGHFGDGNVHLNTLKPVELSPEQFAARCKEWDHDVFSLTAKLRGSIAAEHGIGLLKRDSLALCRTPEEISLMRKLKEVFDPRGILNPGKVLSEH